MPLQRRLPKRGFRSLRKGRASVVNLYQLDRAYSTGELVDAGSLKSRGLIRSETSPFKILAKGDLRKALVVRAAAISMQARAKIEAAGGRIEVA